MTAGHPEHLNIARLGCVARPLVYIQVAARARALFAPCDESVGSSTYLLKLHLGKMGFLLCRIDTLGQDFARQQHAYKGRIVRQQRAMWTWRGEYSMADLRG